MTPCAASPASLRSTLLTRGRPARLSSAFAAHCGSVAPTRSAASSKRRLPPPPPAWQHSTTNTCCRAAAHETGTMAPQSADFTIVGAGRVGEALAAMGAGHDVLVRRGQPVAAGLEGGPIVVCTRNDDLQAVLDATPPARRPDLVFIQNGMLQPWLQARGLGDNTQVLVYFAVAKKGDPPTDGKTDVNPEGLTAAYGEHAAVFASRLHTAGLSCKVLGKPEFTKCMLEKLIWISTFMLVGARHGGCTVGQVEAEHKAEVEALIWELAAAGSAALGVALDPGVEGRLCAYARSVAHFPTAVKEFEWRNGWFHSLSQQALAAGRPDPLPTHTAWLKEVGAV